MSHDPSVDRPESSTESDSHPEGSSGGASDGSGQTAAADGHGVTPPLGSSTIIFSSSADAILSGPGETQVSQHTVISAGPIPAPEVMRAYAELDPSFPDRLIRQFEAESDPRRREERRASAAQVRDLIAERAERRIGQILASLMALAMLAASVWATLAGHAGVATAIVGLLAVVIGLFVTGQYIGRSRAPRSDDRAEHP